MNTTDTYTKDGLIKHNTAAGRDILIAYYAKCDKLPVFHPEETGREFFISRIATETNKYRIKLRQRAMAVYGD